MEIRKVSVSRDLASQLKGVKTVSLARLHGRFVISAYKLAELAKLAKDAKTITVAVKDNDLVFSAEWDNGLRSTSRLVNLYDKNGLWGLKQYSARAPERPAPFVKAWPAR